MTERLVLPFPPSMNGYWRSIVRGSGRRAYAAQILSSVAREYVGAVQGAVGWTPSKKTLTGRLRVSIELWPPTNHRRDLDNYPKAINDALTKAGVWEDDSQIDELVVQRKKIVPGGRAIVIIEEIEQ